MHPNVGCGQRGTRRGAGRRLRGPHPDVGPPSEPPERLRERRRAGAGGGAAPALLRAPPRVPRLRSLCSHQARASPLGPLLTLRLALTRTWILHVLFICRLSRSPCNGFLQSSSVGHRPSGVEGSRLPACSGLRAPPGLGALRPLPSGLGRQPRPCIPEAVPLRVDAPGPPGWPGPETAVCRSRQATRVHGEASGSAGRGTDPHCELDVCRGPVGEHLPVHSAFLAGGQQRMPFSH